MFDTDRNVDVMLGEPRRAVLSMFLPVFIALLIGQLNTFVDAAWCSGLGLDAMSAITLCSSLYFMIVGIGNGIGIGANVAISRRIGAGDKDGAERCASQTIVTVILISFPLIPIFYFSLGPLFTAMGGQDVMEECMSYATPMVLMCTFTMLSGVIAGVLRGEGAANLSTAINVTSAVCNMLLDPLLIFVLGMGLTGASCATVLSSLIAVLLAVFIYRSRRTYLSLRYSKPEKAILYDVFYVGLPQTAELVVMGLMNLILVSIVVYTGGTDGLAIYGIPWNFMTLAMVPVHALAAAMVPVCSSAIGQRDRDRLKSGYYFSTASAFTVATVLALLIWVFADSCMMVFTYTNDMGMYRDEMVHVVRIYVRFLAFYGMIFVGSSMLSCLRKSGWSLMSSFLRNVMLIGLYLLASGHGMEWIYWSLTIGEIIGGVAMILLAQIMFQRKYRDMGIVQKPA